MADFYPFGVKIWLRQVGALVARLDVWGRNDPTFLRRRARGARPGGAGGEAPGPARPRPAGAPEGARGPAPGGADGNVRTYVAFPPAFPQGYSHFLQILAPPKFVKNALPEPKIFIKRVKNMHFAWQNACFFTLFIKIFRRRH